MVINSRFLAAVLFAIALRLPAQNSALPIGIFENHADVGIVLHPGAAEFDASTKSYTLSGSGENMWAAKDAFHFVWKKASGDVTLSADLALLGQGGDPHRKAVLMIRQSLDEGSAYVDAAMHGDGLTSLQARDENGVATHEVQSNVSSPKRLRLSKRGREFYMSIPGPNGEFQMAGGSMRFPLEEPFYVGIGVCAHNKDKVEKAKFSNVSLVTAPAVTDSQPVLYSTLETVTVTSTDRRVVYVVPERMEAPNWTRDGSSLIFNSKGHILRIPVAGGKPETIDTAFALRCNNDHGISPDGTTLAISDQSITDRATDGKSRIYTVPINGGMPKLITKDGPSYWHGWSPDGKTVAYCAQRNGEFDVYTIPLAGGEEKRLTTAKGLDDGPEYSPDGKYIYFNSDRTGTMQIWRMLADGSEQEQITSDDANNWFPHISPDGRQISFVTFDKSVTGHPQNKEVMVQVMTLADRKVRVLAKLFGGQGTLNVNSWSPDSRRLAFVSYQLIPPEE